MQQQSEDKQILRRSKSTPDAPDYTFYCPGCETSHGVWTTNHNYCNAIWGFNQNMQKPTFSPSIKITVGHNPAPSEICHLYVEDGMLKFQRDCTHHLVGQTIPMVPF